MPQIHIISVGKTTNHLKELCNHYEKMITCGLKITEISSSKKVSAVEIKEYEASLIDKALSVKPSFKIALNITGKKYSSLEFSALFNQVNLIEFIIGGAFGLSEKILNKANLQLSLSPLTFPHGLAKVILLEQIYRSQTITNGHPYHK